MSAGSSFRGRMSRAVSSGSFLSSVFSTPLRWRLVGLTFFGTNGYYHFL